MWCILALYKIFKNKLIVFFVYPFFKAFFPAYSFATLYGDVANNYPQGDSPQYGYGTTFWYNMTEYTTTREYFDQGTIAGGKAVSVITGQRNGYQYSPAIENLSDVTDGQRSIKIEALS
jgi:hypothetical protein